MNCDQGQYNLSGRVLAGHQPFLLSHAERSEQEMLPKILETAQIFTLQHAIGYVRGAERDTYRPTRPH